MNEAGTYPNIPYSQFITSVGTKQTNAACKFINDLTALATVKLRENLEKSNSLIQPLQYHSRTSHILPTENNPIIPQLNQILNFTSENQMKLNTDKTKVMIFNRSKKYDFQPEILFQNDLIDVVESSKLLGVMISSNLKWNMHVQFISQKL